MSTQALSDRRTGLDVPMTTLSLGIPLDQMFIGDRVLPRMMHPTSKATLMVWGTEAFRIREDKIGDWSEPDQLDISYDKTTFEIDGHAFKGAVSRREQVEAQRGLFQVDLDYQMLQTIKASMALSREKGQADLIRTASAYSPSHVLDLNGLSQQWDDPAVDPLATLIDVVETLMPNDSGMRPNTLWMGQAVWAKLIQNPLVRVRIMGTTGPQPLPTAQQFASLIGIDTILVGRAVSRTEGGVITKIWGKDAGLIYVPPTAGARVPAFGYTVSQSVYGNGSEAVVRWPDENIGASGGDWIKRSDFYTPTILFKDAGVLLQNVVA